MLAYKLTFPQAMNGLSQPDANDFVLTFDGLGVIEDFSYWDSPTEFLIMTSELYSENSATLVYTKSLTYFETLDGSYQYDSFGPLVV